ncbi:MAG: glycosyl hydrolase family 28 protein [Bacteroidota bacterium]
MWKPFTLLLVLYQSLVASPSLDVRDFGATGDGTTLDTKSIQAAINKARKNGGGTVFLGTGTYLSGTLELHSHITLVISPGATLLGSKNLEDYQAAHPHLIYSNKASHVTLTGGGTINGQGDAFYDSNFKALPRPKPWIQFTAGSHIRVRDLNLINSPAHVLVIKRVDRAWFQNLSIVNHKKSPNTDGIDIHDSKHVFVSDCYFSTGDDAICLKSKRDFVEYVTVTNCIIESDDAALKLGTGSKMGVRHCRFSNITITDTRYGVAMFMVDGGVYEHIDFSGISISGRSRHTNDYPIYMDIDMRDEAKPLGSIRNIRFRDIFAQTNGNILISGQPTTPISGLSFDHVTIQLEEPADLKQVKRKPRGNKTFTDLGKTVDYSWVESTFTLGHVRGVKMSNVTINQPESSGRTEMYLIDVEDIEEVGNKLKKKKVGQIKP